MSLNVRSRRSRFVWLFLAYLYCGAAAVAQDDAKPGTRAAAGQETHLDDAELEEDPELAKRRRETFLEWLMQGPVLFGLTQLIAGAVGCGLTIRLVRRGEGPFVTTALIFIVPVPFWLGLYGTLDGIWGAIREYSKPMRSIPLYQMIYLIGDAIVPTIHGLVLMAPSYIAAMVGSYRRAIPVTKD